MFNNFLERIQYMTEATNEIMGNPKSALLYFGTAWITGLIVGAIQIYAKTKEFV